ncbi:CPBP family intramembrane metalloprotease [Lysobacter arenosi]|uniref:CPBP family intramembrane metalloprotease n=1 Tax=Lysobacter arenosi TaxID=2795387 RepID=A0ABX7RAL6_9GAMM|nr:type II CAAX endopeptidase family protein [Lysobacter arenosi]QSX74036.1 CPBP family intramembrane metalloprotease [Lysobacter arenosi]
MTEAPSISQRAWQALLKLVLGLAAVTLSMLLFRSLLLPALVAVFHLAEPATAVLRRSGILAFALLGYWLFVRFHEKRAATELRIVPLGIGLGALSGALLISITTLSLFALGNYEVVAVRGMQGVPPIAGAILVAAVIEEIVFRGIVFRALEGALGTVAAVLVQSLVFAIMHWFNAGADVTMVLALTLIGAFWTCVFIASRNLWVVGLHHAAWNFAIFATGIPLSGMEDWRAKAPLESIYHGPTWLTGGEFGPETSIITAVVVLASIVVLVRWTRRQQAATA